MNILLDTNILLGVLMDRKAYKKSRLAAYTSEEMAKILAAHGNE